MSELELFPESAAGPVKEPVEEVAAVSAEPLTAVEKEILLLEQKWFKYQGVKANQIREKFDWTPTQYYQRLNALLDKEAALAWDPITVKRLKQKRRDRQLSRSARRLDHDL